ncbi:hypothetical protein AB6C48_09885 [Vibrio splendidus]
MNTKKKIISLNYYSDFSRFFCEINSNIESVDWKHYCIYPSSYVYLCLRNEDAILLPRHVNERSDLDDSILLDLCSYELYENTSEKYKNYMFNKARQYVSLFMKLILVDKPDLAIISGDERLQSKALKYVVEKMGVKHVFFEQGPFNTTILDRNGVNANCSFRKENKESAIDIHFEERINSKPLKWKYNYIYRMVDFICINCLNEFKELEKIKIGNLSKAKSRLNLEKAASKSILLVLQVPEDANLRCHSPYFSNHYEIVKKLSSCLPVNYELIVREHPNYIGKYEERLYDFIDEFNIKIDNETQLNLALKDSELIIVNNSTVGLEAMAYERPLIVLGNSYYDNENYVFKYNGENLDTLIIEALHTSMNLKSVRNRLNYLFEHNFIRGHFRDMKVSEEIIKRVRDYVL